MFSVLKLYVEYKMWLIGLAMLAGVIFYMYSIRGSIKIATKSGCSSCPGKQNEYQKTD